MWLDIQLTCLQAISIGHSPVTKKKKKIVSYFFSTLYLSSIEKKYQQTSDSVCVCVCVCVCVKRERQSYEAF